MLRTEAHIVGRLAPSPTGQLHLGHARSFLLAWWHARSRKGRILMRIEDLDRTRVKPGMTEACLRDLEWLGLDWDGEVERQSENVGALEAVVRELWREGRLYPCVCTRREIELARSAPHLEDGTTRYPGTCRGRYASVEEARAATGRDPALRFRVEGGEVDCMDLLHGVVWEDVGRSVGDFPVTSRDGQVAYQLAVVADDARSGVTEVLRGDDLLPSTARQALLLDALGHPRPTWIHVPLVVDGEGRRLAKRHDALSLARLRAEGVAPERIVAWAAGSAGIEGAEPGLAGEFAFRFELSALPLEPVVCGPRELSALRGEI